MKRRALSLFLTLVMIVSLFAGLGASASAVTNDEIGQLFDRYLTGDKIDSFFTGNPVQSGYCEAAGTSPVAYQIYRVDPNKVRELQADSSIVEQNQYFQKLRERFPDFRVDGQQLLNDVSFDLPLDQDYYAVKVFGVGGSVGQMADYSLTTPAPWNGHIVVDGEDVDLTEQLLAAYIDKGVKNVGERAFFGMDGLMLVYLGTDVKEIGARAFETCDYLSAINFPANLEKIGRRAFYACDYLTFVRMKSCSKLKRIEDRAFCTCSRLTMVAFPESITSIGKFAFAWDHVLGTEQFSLPSKLKTVEQGAFAFCTHLGAVNELVIPANVTSIDDWAFTCVFNMRALQINPGEQALRIGTGAFAGCGGAKTILFPNRVTDIGDYAFAACDKLEDVAFCDKNASDLLHLRNIGNQAFVALQGAGLDGLRRVADGFKEGDSDDEEYVDGSREAAEAVSGQAYDLAGVTPLKRAAFGYIPPVNATEASSDLGRSFPTTVTVYYPSQEYNATAYSKWRSEVKYDGSLATWRGYLCEATWEGHYHVYNGEPTIIPRTCTEDGKEIYTCMYWDGDHFCGHVEERITEKATGHHSEMVEMIDPTCTEAGVAYFHCDNPWCDQPSYTEVLPALGHEFNAQSGVYVAPTCEEGGYAKGTCLRCGKTVDETYPAKGHNIEYMKQVKAPTCTEEGLYQGNCPDCEFGKTHVVQQTVPALGHNWDEGHIVKQPTATEDGSKRYTCTRCGETYTEVLPKTIHTHHYVDTVVAPTCTAYGYTHHECSICGDAYDTDRVAPAHSWDNGVVAKAPTATEKGVRLFTCTVCGAYRTEDIDPVQPTVSFRDVTKGDYFYDSVNWAVQNGITQGVGDNLFDPNGNCTRGQAVTFLYRAAGSPPVSGASTFRDVARGDYFYNAVIWAVQNGITQGVGDGLFDPNGACTRAHIVTFLHRSHQNPSPRGANAPFWDVEPDGWYTKPVIWAVENGITQGTGNGAFSPEDTCTRAQIVTFLYRDKVK